MYSKQFLEAAQLDVHVRVGWEYPQLHDVDGQGHPEVWLPLRGQPEGEAESQKVRGLSWKVIGSNPSAGKHSLETEKTGPMAVSASTLH